MLNKSTSVGLLGSSVDLFIKPYDVQSTSICSMNRSARGIVEEDDVHSTSTG